MTVAAQIGQIDKRHVFISIAYVVVNYYLSTVNTFLYWIEELGPGK